MLFSSFQKFFHPEELMQMVVGCQDYDFRDLEKVGGHLTLSLTSSKRTFSQPLKEKFTSEVVIIDSVIIGLSDPLRAQ